jgi:hypothetical protein
MRLENAAQVWKTKNTYTVLVWKLLGQWSFESLTMRQEDNIKMDLMETGCKDEKCMELY